MKQQHTQNPTTQPSLCNNPIECLHLCHDDLPQIDAGASNTRDSHSLAITEHENMPVVRIPICGPKDAGLCALIDADDAPLTKQYKWQLGPTGRHNSSKQWRHVISKSRSCPTIVLARLIMNAPEEMDVLHLNRDPLDNRRCNLRVVTHNIVTVYSKRDPGVSGYRGVRSSCYGTWIAYICIEGKRQHIGSYKTREEAARAYDRAAQQAWGEYAQLNFPTNEEDHSCYAA